jgi:hypothetical protein
VAGVAHVALKSGKGRLGFREITRFECFTDGLEILVAIGSPECLPILIGAGLAEGGQGGEFLLGCIHVAGFQVLSELRDIGLPLLVVGLQLLVDRSRWAA